MRKEHLPKEWKIKERGNGQTKWKGKRKKFMKR